LCSRTFEVRCAKKFEKPRFSPQACETIKEKVFLVMMRPSKTPGGADFIVPTKALNDAIAAEWQAQEQKPKPATMPLTQLAVTAIDIVAKNRSTIIDQIAAYAQSELLCHRAEAPQDLIERQQRMWQPVLDWCMKRYDAALLSGAGIMPITQQPSTIKTLRHTVEVVDNFRLVGLQQAVNVSGSLVLGLALAEKHLTAGQVFEAAELDATYQIEKWGEDPAETNRRAQVKRELEVCEEWFRLLA
jgi:chaperone required for assembly of F1-ATPase